MDTFSYLKKTKAQLESLEKHHIDLSFSGDHATSPTGYWYGLKKEGMFIFSNELVHMLKWSPQNLYPEKMLFDAIHPEDKASFEKHYIEAMTYGKSYKMTCRLMVQDQILWHVWSTEIDIDEHQVILGLYGTLTCVDEDVTMRQKLIQLEAKLKTIEQKHQEALEAVRADVTKKGQSKMMFLSNMSHEIRTPMNAIIGFANLLNQKASPHEQKEYIDRIKDASNHLLEIINDILDYSKIESGKITLEHDTFKLDKLLADVKSIVIENIKRKNLYFDIETMSCPEVLKGDLSRIRQILINLLSNAVKFTDTGGISVVAYVKETIDQDHVMLAIKVKDTGIGMTQLQQQKIFNDFEQADVSTTRLYGGTGLGLSISKRLSELMGGNILLESKLNEGSEFTLVLPLELADAKEIVSDDDLEPLKKPKEGAHILVAEDNFLSQKLVHRILTNMGMVVTLANHGKIASDLAKTTHFDLIILDLMMPTMDGFEAATEIRKNNKQTPILAMTASVFEEDIEKCLEAGMNDHISKPIDPKSLYKALSRWIPSD